MSDTALTNKVALAKTGDKLKHWTQAIRDLYDEFLDLKGGVVPQYHASPTQQYGIGNTFKYGHLKLLDKLLYKYKKNAAGAYWNQSEVPIKAGYRWNAVTFHSGLFIAVGSHGRIITSTDGNTWNDIYWSTVPQEGGLSTPVSPTAISDYISQFEFYDVAWCGNIFVAVGSFNTFVYSYDGIYWHMPMFVGSCYTSAGNASNPRYVLVEHDPEDLTVCPSGFTRNDAWKGVAYDEQTGTIFLCGTQSRTMACRYSPISTVARIVFEDTVFHVEDPATSMTRELRSVAAMKLTDRTAFVACGTWNEVVTMIIEHDSLVIHGQIVDNVERIAPMTIQKTGDAANEDTAWNDITTSQGADGIERFVMIGTSGRAMASMTGVANSWAVPDYEDTAIRTDFTCQATGGNLTVAAGMWTDLTEPNIAMYDDSVYTEEEDVVYGSSVSVIQHFLAYIDSASWYGAAFGNGTFVLAGDSNRLYWQKTVEQDYSGAALSVEFYKRYLAELKEKIAEIEGYVIRSDMSFKVLSNTTKVFNWSDRNAQMFRTAGEVTLSFNSAPESIYKEMLIYLEAAEETTLKLGGSAEWDNDLAEPEWGRMNSHLTMKAIFIGTRVIIQIIDNDQLADNLLEDSNPDSSSTGG